MTRKTPISNPKKSPAKKTPAAVGAKAAPPRRRPRKKLETPTEEEIRMRAYALWESRGRPMGSPEADWFNAQNQIVSAEMR